MFKVAEMATLMMPAGAWNMLVHNVFLGFFFRYKGSSHAVLVFIFICQFFVLGKCLDTSDMSYSEMDAVAALPIDTVFKFPAPLPTWSSGGGFGAGVIDLGGGLQVKQVSTFQKIWAKNDGGPNNLGATFFEPSPLPDGFSMLGSYAQPNNQPLFGWVLVGKTNASDQSGDILKKPTDYTLVWSNTEESGYIWLPTPPEGYKAVGHVVTTSPDKPSLDKILCVRSDFTDASETENWIWGEGGLNVYGMRPTNRGISAQSVSVGTFVVPSQADGTLPLSCLKNNNFSLSTLPDLNQTLALFQAYSPYVYFHPKETHLPSSVNWYFANGALLYTKGDESNPVPIELNGTNLPQGGSNDGAYWIDLPIDDGAKEKVKGGDLATAEAYVLAKPMLGATFTDIQVWIFYPFNGHATAKLGAIKEISLGKIGEHVGDWEHVTLRISNFDGILYRVYFAQHSKGTWIDSCLLEFQTGNKFVAYSSLNGHATYYQAGSGVADIGIRNDTAKSDMMMDTGSAFSLVAADAAQVAQPAWLNFTREWGPKISYDVANEVKKIEKLMFGKLKSMFKKLVDSLPDEVFGEQGPTGPKAKDSWAGDEK